MLPQIFGTVIPEEIEGQLHIYSENFKIIIKKIKRKGFISLHLLTIYPDNEKS